MKLSERIYLIGSGTQRVLADGLARLPHLPVDGGGEFAIVDTGGGRSTEALVEAIAGRGLDPG